MTTGGRKAVIIGQKLVNIVCEDPPIMVLSS